MVKNLTFLFLFILSFPLVSFSQVVWTEPLIPTAEDAVTLYFDAAEGNAGLAGCNCDVYLHTGLLTENSTNPSDWKYVFTSWGVANNAWKMTPVAGQPDVYSYEITPSIREHYNVLDMNEDILQMAFVFRNADGSQSGRAVGGADIFYDVAPDAGLSGLIQLPAESVVFAAIDETIDFKGVASESSMLSLYDNGNLVTSISGTSLETTITVTVDGIHEVEFVVDNGMEQDTQSFTYVVATAPEISPLPAGTELGINYLDDNTVRLALDAPEKEIVYLIGDFNNWEFSDDFKMKRTPDGETWWIEVGGLNAGQYYAFQYVVDGTIRIFDPYSELVLDPLNDQFISDSIFPNLPPYPIGKTERIVSLLRTAEPGFDWQVDDFQRPEQSRLVIYELLLRDFLASHSYIDLIDTLDYFERLGVNAIELMPINEFSGNINWGYDPVSHYAIDKYYGTPDAFRQFVDACHQRGIAVIVDVVFNHANEKHPLAWLYWDADNFQPAEDNPWFNQQAPHDFSVFFDFNHDQERTKTYVKRVLEHWLEAYNIDGYRFDLSKGLTQNENGPFHAGDYDAKRIALLKEYADHIWSVSPGAYVTLEHFTTNTEERELANYGMMLWTGFPLHENYMEAAMGYPSDLNGVSYKPLGWNSPHRIAYMESHDEERMIYKCLEFGNSGPNGYNTKELSTALDRAELASAFFYSIPGPKLLWQFGEFGYDYSINYCEDGTINSSCRTHPKPIRWDYIAQDERSDLYNTVRALNYLRNNYDDMHSTDFNLYLTSFSKRVYINGDDLNVAVLGNFDVKTASVNADFQHTGWWYEYFSGDSLEVSNTEVSFSFDAGEYRLYTDQKIDRPAIYTDANEPGFVQIDWGLAPNPSSGPVSVMINLPNESEVAIRVFDLHGRLVKQVPAQFLPSGSNQLRLEGLNGSGLFIVELMVNGQTSINKLVLNNKQ